MAARKKKAVVEIDTSGAVLSKYQKFEPVTVHRSLLKGADYNPRILTDAAKAKLKRGLETVGLISAITWNRASGNVVGGHQRLSIIDALEGSPNYLLSVNAVDMTEAEEIEANILLNNGEAQGEYDLEKLASLFDNDAVRVEATGFNAADLYQLLGDDPAVVSRGSVVDELAESIRRTADKVQEVAHAAKRDELGFYTVVVFRDDADRLAFNEALGLDDNRFQDGRKLRALLKPD